MFSNKLKFVTYLLILTNVLAISCTKLLDINPPIGTITTREMFENDIQASYAMAGLYSKMINGNSSSLFSVASQNFAAGLSTANAGLSADEFNYNASYVGSNENELSMMRNKIRNRKSDALWTTAYKIVYDASAILEGLNQSTSEKLTERTRSQLTGEALAIRAFCYFQLINFYGDVPLLLNTDIKVNMSVARTPKQTVYQQIIADLKRAADLLVSDYSYSSNEKVRVNKWFAQALLARVYLYTENWGAAASLASEVIGQRHLYSLETNLDSVFLKNSKEAIFQLKQAQEASALNLATPEGALLTFDPGVPGAAPIYTLTQNLLDDFEPGDLRKTAWITQKGTHHLANKYKNVIGTEYYMVMRLSELHLIRAEAIVRSNSTNLATAIEDINLLRVRAKLIPLDEHAPKEVVLDAVYKERRIELFAEWGHRWFDLKRTGTAEQVLSVISYKQPWWGNFQLLYPIPVSDIESNTQLIQNPEYDNY